MKRLYEQVALTHFKHHQQMLFLAGPRQVGKTTLGETLQKHFAHSCYLNFDIESDRVIILRGTTAIIEKLKLHEIHKQKPLLILDELHKYKHCKQFLKGFYDQYKSQIHILVTGSAKLNIFQKSIVFVFQQILLSVGLIFSKNFITVSGFFSNTR